MKSLSAEQKCIFCSFLKLRKEPKQINQQNLLYSIQDVIKLQLYSEGHLS